MDLQFSYTLRNDSALTVPVWISLCDYYGCEDVIVIDLLPYEVISERLPNPVLDTMLDEFYTCLDCTDCGCEIVYDVEVWIGEEQVCAPVLMDYHYEGLFAY